MRAPIRFFILFLAILLSAERAPAEKLEDTISYLLDYVSKSNATFIRNGVTHTPAEAVAHIKEKYQYFKPQIKTPEDFIRLSASKSLLSGKSYLVRTPDGREWQLRDWLTKALEAHRAGSTASEY